MYAAIADLHRVGRPFVHMHTMQTISFEFILCHFVRGFVVELDEFSNGTHVRILRSPAHSCRLEGLHGSLVDVFHRLLLINNGVRGSLPGVRVLPGTHATGKWFVKKCKTMV